MITKGGAGLTEMIEDKIATLSDAERVVANFLLSDRQNIPFETAVSVAKKVGVSSVTVGRFCQRIGFRNFRELKAALRYDIGSEPWPSSTPRGSAGGNEGLLKRDREMTIAAISEVYQLAGTAEWNAIVSLLDSSEEVLVAGFQTERGIAEHFAHTLQYVRPGVRMADLAAGSFADILTENGRGKCVVIVEIRRYSRQAKLLAERAAAAGFTIVIVTDKFCHWAKEYTPHVLALPDESALFFATLVPMVAALTLLVQEVVLRRGDAAKPRLDLISELYQEFTGHVGQRRTRTNRDDPQASV
ncbi:DNA-binding MurR/RpiR family transcriptional regulator [Sphingopyxis panaciterrae]|uniref:MurR/RpiR family transcriptional regulator n=1 Tax=Sphingopyxis panaciterrae TaxID=363841 RepID=UPI001ABA1F1D|nr:MurR/RpiR family transcriptional regulator [Sphingopyxis panaciterrae]NIJ38470.1 DNA-binding MurR/RpiR family transcriptional regulator [Sphingopyxis panaciterrae]